jgi:hypothetical protein
LVAIGQQLDPLDIAESEVRFIQLSQDELTTNHADLIDQLKSEASDENHINSAITELHQKLRTILAELPDLDKDGLERVRNEALPAMKKQLNDINSRNATAEQNRQLIKREWPDENTTQNTAQSLIDQIDSKSNGQKQQIQQAEANLLIVQDQINVQYYALIKEIQELETIINDPNSTVDQLQRSTVNLLNTRPKLDAIDALYKDLDIDDPKMSEIRAKTAEKLKSLNDLFQHQQKSASERIQIILQQQNQQLKELVDEGHQILLNLPDSVDSTDDYSNRLNKSTKMAQDLTENMPHQDPQIAELAHLVDVAKQTRQLLDYQAGKWIEFNVIRNDIRDKQLSVQQKMDFEQAKGMQKLDETQKTLKSLEVSSFK